MLYVVGTPIGNIRDITLRALDILKEVDLIAAEDTRRTRNLLVKYEIKNKVTSYHDYNKEKRTPELIAYLKQGQDIALVTDSGTPTISDPGMYLVREASRQGIDISPIPGPSAAIAALSASGLPSDIFTFRGFVPKKKGRKRSFLGSLEKDRTTICYESPYRIRKTLAELDELHPGWTVCVARELTKKHEEIRAGTPKELLDVKEKGEFVLLLHD